MTEAGQDWGGPYLQAAFFCERLLEEADGVFSAIRIIDRVMAQVADAAAEALPPVPINLTLFIAFKTGRTEGTYDLTVALESPSELAPTQRHTLPVLFEGGDNRGNTIIMPIAMSVDREGLYWFGVYLGDRLITRVPLQVLQERTGQVRPPP